MRALREYDGSIDKWWDDFRGRVAFTKAADETLLMLLGVSACFSAGEDGTPELPFDPASGLLRQEVWQRWLDWDPVRMVPKYADALRGMRAIWVDGGTRDEWFLDVGGQAFCAALAAGRRQRRPFRAVRRHPRPHRVPLPAVPGVPGRKDFVAGTVAIRAQPRSGHARKEPWLL